MLKKIIAKPHLFFFGLTPIFILIGFLKNSNTLNISIGYVYFDVKLQLICNITALFFLLIGFNYYSLFWTQKKINKSLTITHVVLQLITLIPFLLLLFLVNKDGDISSAYLHSVSILLISFVLFLVSIFIHLINFFTSFFLNKE